MIPKVLYVCNRGGHYSQLLSLRGLMAKTDSHILTDKKNAQEDFGDSISCNYITAFNYKKNTLVKIFFFLLNLVQATMLCIRIRPKYIVTTGAGIAVPAFIIGKLFRCKLIYIETRARVYSKSSTGKLLSNFSDYVFVQWPEMIEVYNGKAIYVGTIV